LLFFVAIINHQVPVFTESSRRRKVIRSQATEFRYQRSRQPLPRIDPWRDQLEGLLLENQGNRYVSG
jgi:hypothetical protein